MAFAPLHRLARIIGLGIVVATLGTCDRQGAPVADPPSASEVTTHETRPATLRGWHYRVTPDPRLESAAVEVCFVGDAPPMLTLGADEALPHIHDVRRADATPYVATATGYRLESMPADGCLTYTVDFNGLEADQGVGRGVGRTGNSLMLRASAWLLRPAQRPSEADVTLRLSLPEGMSAALPWATRGDGPRGTSQATYVVPDTSFYWTSIAVLGDLAIDRFEHAGTSVELVRLDAEIACTPDGLRSWVIDAIDTVAMLFEGRFPRQRLQLMVLPTEGGGNQSVYFGMATRGGGPGVLIFLDDQAKAEALPGGWTTVHELLHHGMPFIDDSWMGEGWVSYYTELMRTRMGHRTEVEGWQALLDAFERGRRRSMDISLAETSDKMHETHAYQRVYWGGAAVAFDIDVQMRIESDGARTLDEAMRHLRQCCGDAPHLWSAGDLLAQLDTWYGSALFSRTAKTVLEAKALPDIEATMARLGVQVHDGKVQLDEQSPNAAIRRSIMAPRRQPSSP